MNVYVYVCAWMYVYKMKREARLVTVDEDGDEVVPWIPGWCWPWEASETSNRRAKRTEQNTAEKRRED